MLSQGGVLLGCVTEGGRLVLHHRWVGAQCRDGGVDDVDGQRVADFQRGLAVRLGDLDVGVLENHRVDECVQLVAQSEAVAQLVTQVERLVQQACFVTRRSGGRSK